MTVRPLLLAFAFVLAAAPSAYTATPECIVAASGPSRFEKALAKEGKPRLDRFRTSTSNRYARDSAVQGIAAKIAEGNSFDIKTVLSGISGDVKITRTGPEVEINIPVAKLVDDSEKGTQEYNTHSAGLSAHFVKLMTGVFLGAERLAQRDPEIRVLKVASHIVNEALANLLLDLGFDTPIFGRTLTRDEVHFIITEKKFPPSLYDFAEKIRAESQETYAKLTGSDRSPTAEEKALLAVPIELRLEL